MDFNKKQPLNFCTVNGFGVQQIGANCAQEIAYSLSCGQEYLHHLIEAGMTVDDASACINFQIGVGSNYFNEIAKLNNIKKRHCSGITTGRFSQV